MSISVHGMSCKLAYDTPGNSLLPCSDSTRSINKKHILPFLKAFDGFSLSAGPAKGNLQQVFSVDSADQP